MKLLLLQPPIQDFYDTDVRLQPIGLAYLKAAVKKHLPQIEVTIKNFHHGWGRRTIAVPRDFAYLKNFYAQDDKSPFSSFHHYYHFGAEWDTIAREVALEKPDLIGISVLFAPYYREALACADAIKKKWKVPILAGGAFASTMPEWILSHPSIDFVIRGEGEKPLVEFLKVWKNGKNFARIPNLGYKKKEKIFLNPLEPNFPVESLPFPDLTDLPQEQYQFEKKPLCFMITSRGCPYQCAFCSVHKTFGRNYRKRSPDHILAEMQERYAQGYRVFDFEDDNFAFHKEETLELCRKIQTAFPKRDVQLLAMNGICYWTLDHEVLAAMRRAGFTHLNISLVSTNAPLLKTLHRPTSLTKYRFVVRQAATLGFKIVSYQILGLPGETLPSMIKTLLFNAKLPVLLGASPFYLIPHTPIAKPWGRPTETDIFKARLTAMAIETGQFRREDIYTLFITTRILNFLKGIPLRSKKVSLRYALKTAASQDFRSAKGVEILQRLLSVKKFHAYTPLGLKPLLQFQASLFFRIWNRLNQIQTQENKTVRLR